MAIKVGIYGAAGYTGIELAQLLAAHPEAEICFLTSESSAGKTLQELWPLAPAFPLSPSIDAPLEAADCIFLCLPHTQSAPRAAQALAQGIRVIDLSADLRIDDPAEYARWYKVAHPAPELLPVPYGLPELGRDLLVDASVIATPGCYATATLLGLAPLVREGLIAPHTPIIVDAKSGVTGAGRTPKVNTLFAEVQGDFSPYNIGRSHRHIAEIEQVLEADGLAPGGLIFSPHLLPTDRGILATIYVQTSEPEAAQAALREAYADESLVEVLPPGQLATLRHVVRTPKAVLSMTAVNGILIVVSVLDNLLKGAASQAVQNFNLMWGLPETMGLIPTQVPQETL